MSKIAWKPHPLFEGMYLFKYNGFSVLHDPDFKYMLDKFEILELATGETTHTDYEKYMREVINFS